MSRVDNNILRWAQVGSDNWFKNSLVLRCRDSADHVELSVCEVEIFWRPVVRYAVHLRITHVSMMVHKVIQHDNMQKIKMKKKQSDKQ